MNDDEIMKLYRMLRDDLGAMEDRLSARFDSVEKQVDDLKGHIDHHLYGQQETHEVEEGAINHRLGLHEEWIEQAASKVGVAVPTDCAEHAQTGQEVLPVMQTASFLLVGSQRQQSGVSCELAGVRQRTRP